MDEPEITFAASCTEQQPHSGGKVWRVRSHMPAQFAITDAEIELITAYFRPFLDKILADEPSPPRKR